MPATLKFFKLEQNDVTPALGIAQSYVVLAIIVGLGLILVLALLRLSEYDPKIVGGVVLAAVVLSAAVWFGRGAFAGLGNVNLVLFFVVLVGACVAIGVPIAFAFGLGTLSYILIVTNVHADIVVQRMQEGVSNLVLLAVPLFIFLGLLMETAGIAKRLVAALAAWSDISAAGFRSCSSARCTSCRGSPARRSPTWRPSRRCCSPTWNGAARNGRR